MSYYFYRTDNLVNGKFYYGTGSTDNYLGSGKLLKNAIRKYGKENFKINKLKYFPSRLEAYNFEDRFLKLFKIKERVDSYNLINSGYGVESGTLTVMDKDGNQFRVSVDNHQYKSGELVPLNKGIIPVRDNDGKIHQISLNDDRLKDGTMVPIAKGMVSVKIGDKYKLITSEEYKSGSYTHINSGKVVGLLDGKFVRVDKSDALFKNGNIHGHMKGFINVYDSDNNIIKISTDDKDYKMGKYKKMSNNKVYLVDDYGNGYYVNTDDERYLSGELHTPHKGMVMVKDNLGKSFRVSKTDERYLSGDLKPINAGAIPWNKKFTINGETNNAKFFAKKFNINKNNLKDFLTKNNLSYE